VVLALPDAARGLPVRYEVVYQRMAAPMARAFHVDDVVDEIIVAEGTVPWGSPNDTVRRRNAMQRTLATLAALVLVTLGANSRADSNKTPLYDDDLARAEGSKEGRAALEGIARQCEYSIYMRSGPRPQDIAACEKSVARAVAAGPSVVPDALRKLNDRSLGHGARLRTYDVLARVADVRVLASLVGALERSERDPTDRDSIRSTLARISYAKPGEVSGLSADRPDLAAQVAAWRSWLAGHRDMSRAELLEDRIADARAHVADPDVETAFIAARFLAQRKETEREGLAALEAIRDRPNLPGNVLPTVRKLIQRIAPATAPAPAKTGEPHLARRSGPPFIKAFQNGT
jgi:hypothetical protein